MKLTARDTNNFLKNPMATSRALLLFGPDAGLCAERTRQIKEVILGANFDPINVVELTGDRIKDDPAILQDEMSAISLLGGKERILVIRDATDKIKATVEAALDQVKNPTAYLILQADDLSPSSSLRTLADRHKLMVSLGCYREEGRALEQTVRDWMRARNVKASEDVVSFLASQIGNDRQVTQGELQKIELFLGDETYLTLEQAIALTGQNDFFSTDDLCVALLDGRMAPMESYLQRSIKEGTSPIATLRAVQRYLNRLLSVKSRVECGQNPEDVIRTLRPPVFFKYAPSFRRHVDKWTRPQLKRALATAMAAERSLKSGSLEPSLNASRWLHRVAQLGRKAA